MSVLVSHTPLGRATCALLAAALLAAHTGGPRGAAATCVQYTMEGALPNAASAEFQLLAGGQIVPGDGLGGGSTGGNVLRVSGGLCGARWRTSSGTVSPILDSSSAHVMYGLRVKLNSDVKPQYFLSNRKAYNTAPFSMYRHSYSAEIYHWFTTTGYPGGGSYGLQYNTVLNTGVWHYLSVHYRRSDGMYKLYVDGSQVDYWWGGIDGNFMGLQANDTYVGCRDGANNDAAVADIDDVFFCDENDQELLLDAFTLAPTGRPSVAPTPHPSHAPSEAPTAYPSSAPTEAPSAAPSATTTTTTTTLPPSAATTSSPSAATGTATNTHVDPKATLDDASDATIATLSPALFAVAVAAAAAALCCCAALVAFLARRRRRRRRRRLHGSGSGGSSERRSRNASAAAAAAGGGARRRSAATTLRGGGGGGSRRSRLHSTTNETSRAAATAAIRSTLAHINAGGGDGSNEGGDGGIGSGSGSGSNSSATVYARPPPMVGGYEPSAALYTNNAVRLGASAAGPIVAAAAAAPPPPPGSPYGSAATVATSDAYAGLRRAAGSGGEQYGMLALSSDGGGDGANRVYVYGGLSVAPGGSAAVAPSETAYGTLQMQSASSGSSSALHGDARGGATFNTESTALYRPVTAMMADNGGSSSDGSTALYRPLQLKEGGGERASTVILDE